MRLEGIVSKPRAAPYKPGARNASWQKVKCVLRQEFVIGGYEHSVRGRPGRRCGSAPTTTPGGWCSPARSAPASSAKRRR